MGAQLGKDILVRLDETGTGTFETVAGLRANRISFNADTVDVTTTESAGHWRELLAGAGVKTASVTGSGVFKDEASDAALRRIFFDAGIPDLELVIPDFGTIAGPFQVSSLEYSGNHDGEATFEIALSSAGEISFAEL